MCALPHAVPALCKAHGEFGQLAEIGSGQRGRGTVAPPSEVGGGQRVILPLGGELDTAGPAGACLVGQLDEHAVGLVVARLRPETERVAVLQRGRKVVGEVVPAAQVAGGEAHLELGIGGVGGRRVQIKVAKGDDRRRRIAVLGNVRLGGRVCLGRVKDGLSLRAPQAEQGGVKEVLLAVPVSVQLVGRVGECGTAEREDTSFVCEIARDGVSHGVGNGVGAGDDDQRVLGSVKDVCRVEVALVGVNDRDRRVVGGEGGAQGIHIGNIMISDQNNHIARVLHFLKNVQCFRNTECFVFGEFAVGYVSDLILKEEVDGESQSLIGAARQNDLGAAQTDDVFLVGESVHRFGGSGAVGLSNENLLDVGVLVLVFPVGYDRDLDAGHGL